MSVKKLNSTWWRPLIAASALTALAVTPFLFASGIDNDSPFNMPNWNFLPVSGGTAVDGRYANVVPLSIEAETDSTYQIVDHLAPKPKLLLDHVKVWSPGGRGASELIPNESIERLVAVAGSDVRIVDSVPSMGSTTVAVQGKFWISGPALIGLDVNGIYNKPLSFLVFGNEDPLTHKLTAVHQVLPLGYTSGILDIQKLAKLLAQEPKLHGVTAMLVCGHLSIQLSGKTQFALDSTVQFQVSSNPKFLVDTDAKLPN